MRKWTKSTDKHRIHQTNQQNLEACFERALWLWVGFRVTRSPDLKFIMLWKEGKEGWMHANALPPSSLLPAGCQGYHGTLIWLLHPQREMWFHDHCTLYGLCGTPQKSHFSYHKTSSIYAIFLYQLGAKKAIEPSGWSLVKVCTIKHIWCTYCAVNLLRSCLAHDFLPGRTLDGISFFSLFLRTQSPDL